ncbi:hypothetical protein [Hyphomonas sp.]|jgi:protocatechuate 3,4-dioxygenase beta subunit|uniref:dioxygenase family protein n=1 Tax=Hyphomonas sp. TaxID=87 RepID=UPI0032D93313
MPIQRPALARTLALPLAANAPQAYPHDRVLQPGQSLANLWVGTGLIRTGITTGFNGMPGTANGVPVELNLTFQSASDWRSPLTRHAVYVWQADAAGEYSVFNRPDTNYLRGIGVTDARGRVRFQTIYPGTYRGRAPHIHFEVYRSLDTLRLGAPSLIRSRILFPDIISRSVYTRHPVYAESIEKYDQLRFELPVRDPAQDTRSIQVATVSAAGLSTLRAGLSVFVEPTE